MINFRSTRISGKSRRRWRIGRLSWLPKAEIHFIPGSRRNQVRCRFAYWRVAILSLGKGFVSGQVPTQMQQGFAVSDGLEHLRLGRKPRARIDCVSSTNPMSNMRWQRACMRSVNCSRGGSNPIFTTSKPSQRNTAMPMKRSDWRTREDADFQRPDELLRVVGVDSLSGVRVEAFEEPVEGPGFWAARARRSSLREDLQTGHRAAREDKIPSLR